MRQLKFEKIGRFKFQKTWVFPYEVTKFLLMTFRRLGINPHKELTHVFCGESQLGSLRIDNDEALKPDLVANVLDLPKTLGENSQENILADFPWQISYPARRKFSYALRDICKLDGYFILNCPWNPQVKGMKFLECWKVIQLFNSYRDLVDFWIFRRTE